MVGVDKSVISLSLALAKKLAHLPSPSGYDTDNDIYNSPLVPAHTADALQS